VSAARTYLDLLERLAHARGTPLRQLSEAELESRCSERDAALFAAGIRSGSIRVEDEGCRLWTLDPWQATAWLVEGRPESWPCWEYLPHAAAYVELLGEYPSALVRFETPEPELNLDLAVVTARGTVAILGEVKTESRQLDALLKVLGEFDRVDPGKPRPVRAGGPTGSRREAWKLAHQLWATRAPWLWLVASNDRRPFSVRYEPSMMLEAHGSLPTPQDLGIAVGPARHPTLRLHER
jgi:hypothetical protein